MPSLLEPQPTNPEVRLRTRITALENRIAALESGLPIPQITGAPAAGTGQNGSLAADTALRIWVKINGTWRSVAVA